MTNQIFIYHQLWWIPSAGNIVADEKRSLFLWSLYSGGERQIISETKSVQFKVLICYCCQWLSCVWLFVTPWTAACQASLSFTISWNLLTHVHCVNDAISHVILCHHLLLPSIFPSIMVQIAFFFCWSIFFADHCRSNCNSGLTKPWPTQQGVLKHILANRAISCWTKMGSIFTSAWISHWMWTILRRVWPEVGNWGESFRSWELKSLQMALLDVGKQCAL